MPVVKQSVVSFTLTEVVVSMTSMHISCTFTRAIDGVQSADTVGLWIDGPDMMSVLATQATAGQPLGSEITDALYRYALSKGIIFGDIA